jgi:hypothetical protein
LFCVCVCGDGPLIRCCSVSGIVHVYVGAYVCVILGVRGGGWEHTYIYEHINTLVISHTLYHTNLTNPVGAYIHTLWLVQSMTPVT